MNKFKQLHIELHSLVIFRNILKDDVLLKFLNMLSSLDEADLDQLTCYTEFVNALFQHTNNFSDYLLKAVLRDDNFYIKSYAQDQAISESLEQNLQRELQIIQRCANLDPNEIRAQLFYKDLLPIWSTSNLDFYALYIDRLKHISKYGFGIFSEYHMFRSDTENMIVPVLTPDPICLEDLKGYETERAAVIKNTQSLLAGNSAANVLLYGDAGTGKSSSIKAIANEYASQGLRLVEIKQDDFKLIPAIMQILSEQPLKFILFIDDISFEKDNTDFNALKSLLEGGLSTRPSNIAVYATGNRKHMVKESFSQREGDDIHRNETLQELIALSERFGLTVGFFKPDKKEYLKIVYDLKKQYALNIDDMQLDLLAEQYALKRGGRSPRAARYLIEYLRNEE